MKTIGRILMILVVFSILAGLMLIGVNASGTVTQNFEGRPGDDGAEFRPGGGGLRPEGFENRPERGDESGGGPRWMFGAVKNIGLIAVLVTVIVWPKSIARKKKKNGVLKPAVTE